MQVQSTNSYSSPNFGIRYVQPREWNPKVLDTLMKSDLVKQIDKEYPNASVGYWSLEGCEDFLAFNFAKDMVATISSKKLNLDQFVEKIKTTSLENLEKQIFWGVTKPQADNIYKAAEESNRKNATGFFEHINKFFE